MKYFSLIIFGLLFVSIFSFGNAKILTNTGQDTQKNKKDTLSTIAGLPWHSDINTAFRLAQQEHKKVIVMVGEEYCKWCKKMKARTLTDVRIQEKFKRYILVSIKRSDKTSVKYIPEFDGNIPSFFFMKANRELIEPLVGYFTADDFLQYIKEIEEY
ncbi:MAG: thioredoxin family protein [Sulfurovum sp.]|nr:MAG: thioredoxin family protein [Sulfurovum sp.]